MYIVNCDGYIDFNPRSHEGSDSEDRINIYQVNISIHAPTRGATDECRAWKEKHNAFQSTLPRGERPNCFDHCQGEMDISIHAPTRGATLTDLGYEVQFKISIHAPTRGATVFSFLLKDAEKDFNPRSHEGSDDFPWNIPFHI